MKNIIMLIILIVFSWSASSNTEVKKDVTKKIYTEEEFNKKLMEVLGKKLKHLGKGKIVEFSKELIEKERQLRLKEMSIEKKEEQLEISVKDFKKKVKEFTERQNRLIMCLDNITKQESKRVGHMVDTVSNMRPQNAAKVLSVQDSDISVKILAKLPSEKVAKIFNFMDKEISARLQKQFLTMKK